MESGAGGPQTQESAGNRKLEEITFTWRFVQARQSWFNQNPTKDPAKTELKTAGPEYKLIWRWDEVQVERRVESSGEGNEVIRQENRQGADWLLKTLGAWRTNGANSEQVCRWVKEGKAAQEYRRENTANRKHYPLNNKPTNHQTI